MLKGEAEPKQRKGKVFLFEMYLINVNYVLLFFFFFIASLIFELWMIRLVKLATRVSIRVW